VDFLQKFLVNVKQHVSIPTSTSAKQIVDEKYSKLILDERNLIVIPNPFNSTTTINFVINYKSTISMIIYDILGKEVKSFTELS